VKEDKSRNVEAGVGLVILVLEEVKEEGDLVVGKVGG
jgi:hypothetical protein